MADIKKALPNIGHGKVSNGWALPPTSGVYGDDWLVRTLVNYGGIWANTPEEVIYYKAFADPTGPDASVRITEAYAHLQREGGPARRQLRALIHLPQGGERPQRRQPTSRTL